MGIVLSTVIIVSGIIKVSVMLRAQRRVLKMASFTGVCNVKRDGVWKCIPTEDVVPGDLVEITGKLPIS